MSESNIESNGHEATLKAMVSNLTTRLEPLGAEALRSGLAAFITPAQTVEVEAVPLEMIRFSIHTFRLTAPGDNLTGLSDSIKRRGFVGALVGRRKGSMIEIAFGERRVRAAEIAGLKVIPVHVRELDDTAMLELALEENFLQHRLSPLEEGLLFQKLLAEGKYSLETLAQHCTRSVEYVADQLLLVKYPEVQEALRAGRLEVETARALAKIDDRIMRAKMLRQALALGHSESGPTRFIVTSVGLDLPSHSVAEEEKESSGESEVAPPQLWGANGKPKKQAAKRGTLVSLENQYASLETLVNGFVRDLKRQELPLLAQEDSWRKRTRKLLRTIEDELENSFKRLKS